MQTRFDYQNGQRHINLKNELGGKKRPVKKCTKIWNWTGVPNVSLDCHIFPIICLIRKFYSYLR